MEQTDITTEPDCSTIMALATQPLRGLPAEMLQIIIDLYVQNHVLKDRGRLYMSEHDGIVSSNHHLRDVFHATVVRYGFDSHWDDWTLKGAEVIKTKSFAYASTASRIKFDIHIAVKVDPCWEYDGGMYRTNPELFPSRSNIRGICDHFARLVQATDLLIDITLTPETEEYGYATLRREDARDDVACKIMETLHALPSLRTYCLRIDGLKEYRFHGVKDAANEWVATKTNRSEFCARTPFEPDCAEEPVYEEASWWHGEADNVACTSTEFRYMFWKDMSVDERQWVQDPGDTTEEEDSEEEEESECGGMKGPAADEWGPEDGLDENGFQR